MIQIKTLADFKRAIQMGVKLETIYHLGKAIGRDEKGRVIYEPVIKEPREVKTVQSNAFTLLTTNTNGEIVESWLQYPKAKEFKCNGSNTVEIYEEDREGKNVLILTYKFI